MQGADVSRRRFGVLVGTAAATGIPSPGAGAVSAQEIIQLIRARLGGEWPSAGPDGFKAGDPNTSVRGIATTAMATMDVLRQALKERKNLVITYEPTFFGRQESPAPEAPASPAAGANGRGPGRGADGVAADDPVYKAKKEFIEKNGLVIFRLRDHWQARKENDMTAGLAERLGWTRYRVKPEDAVYDIPATTAEKAVALVRNRLNLRGGLRAVGDRKMRVRRVMLHPGVMAPTIMWQRYSETDLIITGEVREWESTHYAADIYTAGEPHGLVTIGRVASEDPGMRMCAEWMKTFVKEVPVRWITAGDLYWRAAG